jgi:hypothetical protein
MTFPVFASGDVLNASDMNGVGLWLVKSQTIGSPVTSVTVTGAFSADYENYRIVVSGGSASADGGLTLTLGSTAAGYYYSMIYSNYTGGSAVAAVNNGAAWTNAGTFTTNANTVVMDILRPFESDQTAICGTYIGVNTGGVNGQYGGYLNNTTSYTAFTLATTGGATMSGGTIRVYGYRN